jgi:hypothetical protein
MDPPRIWNHLVDELNLNTDSLSSFKSAMFIYYISSLYSTCYDVEDPRSFTAICPVRSGILFVVPQRHNGKCTAWDLESRFPIGFFCCCYFKISVSLSNYLSV